MSSEKVGEQSGDGGAHTNSHANANYAQWIYCLLN